MRPEALLGEHLGVTAGAGSGWEGVTLCFLRGLPYLGLEIGATY